MAKIGCPEWDCADAYSALTSPDRDTPGMLVAISQSCMDWSQSPAHIQNQVDFFSLAKEGSKLQPELNRQASARKGLSLRILGVINDVQNSPKCWRQWNRTSSRWSLTGEVQHLFCSRRGNEWEQQESILHKKICKNKCLEKSHRNSNYILKIYFSNRLKNYHTEWNSFHLTQGRRHSTHI